MRAGSTECGGGRWIQGPLLLYSWRRRCWSIIRACLRSPARGPEIRNAHARHLPSSPVFTPLKREKHLPNILGTVFVCRPCTCALERMETPSLSSSHLLHVPAGGCNTEPQGRSCSGGHGGMVCKCDTHQTVAIPRDARARTLVAMSDSSAKIMIAASPHIPDTTPTQSRRGDPSWF